MRTENDVTAVQTHGGALSPRLWLGVLSVVVPVLAFLVTMLPGIGDGTRYGLVVGGPVGGAVLFLVWLFGFSRLAWRERVGVFLVMAALGVGALRFVDRSMVVPLGIYGAPLAMASIVFGVWVGAARRPVARVGLIVVMLAVVWGVFPFLRLTGFSGANVPTFAWRWAALASGGHAKAVSPEALAAWQPTTLEWPGFRGAAGDSRVLASGADVDWSAVPRELWRVPLGAAWSSFAHVSGRLFTQEQLGDEEMVTCLDAATGAVVWRAGYPCRFFDVVAGEGPRATPTYADGRLYTFGGTAILTCLDAARGEILWQHNLVTEVNAQQPVWGFSSSPLVVAGVVIVYAGGDGDNGLVAFDRVSGAPVWGMSSSGTNFSSAQRVEFGGEEQVLFGDAGGLTALSPATGAVQWKYTPNAWKGPAICQPQQIGESSLIVPLGEGVGVARLEVTQTGATWEIAERWVCKKFKPGFNDFVFFEGHCYGFDGTNFACLDAETGEVTWKYRGYKSGQVVLLADAGVLAVTAETGVLALVAAEPAAHRELGTYALLTGKTWNHPMAAAGRLFLRNSEEGVAVALTQQLAMSK